MFDFMRRKKDVHSETDAHPSKPKQRVRRASLMLPTVRTGSSKKRERPMSGSFVPSNENAAGRPPLPRASSSTSSAVSFDFRNPFLDDEELPRMTRSQLDLTRSMGSSSSEPPVANIRHVARSSPTIVHPQGECAEVFYHVESRGTIDPFADEAHLAMSHCEENASEENSAAQTVSVRRRRSSLSAACRKSADYLHVNIPVAMFSPPIGVSHREIWTRV
ncbi:hypothetical protein DAEQUDRAFT_727280 [Daedalea quercina L-15889]|uniref:Uncharacterized protein n=1 Tax=Daedalea quercina L-15889 TaxID=1314783 RepID=A0A165Q6Q0_9APHY|nr:hypothetical protein DAEQUDRAFT_727280 [Daedalea quercina L-15889]